MRPRERRKLSIHISETVPCTQRNRNYCIFIKFIFNSHIYARFHKIRPVFCSLCSGFLCEEARYLSLMKTFAFKKKKSKLSDPSIPFMHTLQLLHFRAFLSYCYEPVHIPNCQVEVSSLKFTQLYQSSPY